MEPFYPLKGADLVRILKKSIFFAFFKSRIIQKYSLKIPEKGIFFFGRLSFFIAENVSEILVE